MSTHEESASSYRVGNKHPPRHTQFQKGRSGNPSGRRKRDVPSKTLWQVLNEQLRQRVRVTVGDHQMLITRLDALMLGLVIDAQKGKAGARKQVLDLLRAGTPRGDPTLITFDAEPHKFSWKKEFDEILERLERTNEAIEAEKAGSQAAGATSIPPFPNPLPRTKK